MNEPNRPVSGRSRALPRWPLLAMLLGACLAGGHGGSARAQARAPDAMASGPATVTLHGRRLAVQDGDTFDLRTDDGQRVRVRIAAIDAPESRQRFAARSREHLQELLGDHDIEVVTLKIDRYGRHVGDVSLAGKLPAPLRDSQRDIGLAQVQAGLAWHFKRYAGEQRFDRRRAYAEAEELARQRKLGLWRDEQPLAPWLYREQTRRLRAARAAQPCAAGLSPANCQDYPR